MSYFCWTNLSSRWYEWIFEYISSISFLTFWSSSILNCHHVIILDKSKQKIFPNLNQIYNCNHLINSLIPSPLVSYLSKNSLVKREFIYSLPSTRTCKLVFLFGGLDIWQWAIHKFLRFLFLKHFCELFRHIAEISPKLEVLVLQCLDLCPIIK